MSDGAAIAQPAPGWEPAALRRWWLAAALWLLCVLAVAAHHTQFWRQGRLNTDVLALLPTAEQDPAITRAARLMSDRVAREIVVLLGAPDWDSARRAAQAWRGELAGAGALLAVEPAGGAEQAAGALADFYGPWRERLLTPAQRRQLAETSPAALAKSALALLHQPGLGGGPAGWAADPLGLGTDWLLARGAQSRARPRDGELWLAGDGMQWVVLRHQIAGTAFSMDGQARYGPALERAHAAALRGDPQLRMVAAGLPLHAEAAAVQASREISTIGWGSLAAVLLLAWLAFRAVTPILLIAASLVVGTATALSVTAWLFGEVHLLTLVFGASLVGVAEDYGIHYYAARQGRPGVRPRPLMRSLLPGLLLALLTSVLAYLALGLAPFPGLRQMAVFSATGLAAAFLTVVCWFPLLDRARLRPSPFAATIGRSLAHWPRARAGRGLWFGAAAAALFTAAGLAQLEASDGLRNWQSSPPALLRAQAEAGRLLGVPSVAQFYLVRGNSAQQVLEREEALKQRLDALVGPAGISGYAAVSDWLPSLRQQQADAALVARIETRVLADVSAALGESLSRPIAPAGGLTPDPWLQHPASAAARGLWLGEAEGQWATLVLLHGLDGPQLLPKLSAAAAGLDGVRWVDRSSEVAAVLGRYRWAMTALLVAGHLAVFAVLVARYGRRAWRAWVPTAAASLLAAASAGWLGEPFQLAHVLALLLLLGIGVDYGIFLLEHEGDGAAWLAVVLGAASTWLAFGLLGLSATPALHAFGLTLMIGIAAVWALSPWLRGGASEVAA